MTALPQYDRLESPGLWREGPEAQRRDVLVSFGDASLVLSDMQETALAHWSLTAVERTNPGEMPALYTPEPEAGETLEIDDETMIDAVETVRGAAVRRGPHRGRLRLALVAALLAVALIPAILWLPGALERQTAALVPEAARAGIGARLLAQVSRVGGRRCTGGSGLQALARLGARLPGTEGAKLHVLEGEIDGAVRLPGGHTVLASRLVTEQDGPEPAAGFILAAQARAEAHDPLARLLADAGLRASLHLLRTGRLPPARIAAHAERLLTQPPEPVRIQPLLARFAAAGLPPRPYARAAGATGAAILARIGADAPPVRQSPPLLSPEAWAALQGICAP